MAAFYFVIVSATGLFLTTITLKYVMQRSSLTHHHYALVLALGFGLTWMVAFFAPFFAPEVTYSLEPLLVLFIVGHSILVTIMTYVIARVWFGVKTKRDIPPY
jgi:hypothetical protein